MSLCYNCFKEIEDAAFCPYCGYNAASDSAKYPLALPHGTVLGGRYVTGKVLGQGGFGITYVAQEYADKRLVAIKEYFPDTLAIRQNHTMVSTINGEREENYRYGMECFLSEAKTLAEFIGNPNIVRIYSYFEENDTAYFAMEYIEGVPLIDYVKQQGGKIPYEEALTYILPIMDALSAVHAKGIIHRDISPDNIIITNDGSVKLIDFGAARYSMGDRSRSLDVVLKHGFAPMEQYTRRGRQGPYTDVYSLAATLYRCITGRIPPDSVDRIAEDSLIPPSGFGVHIPQHAEDAILKALEVMTVNRYQTMAQFKAALTGTDTAAGTSAPVSQVTVHEFPQPVPSYTAPQAQQSQQYAPASYTPATPEASAAGSAPAASQPDKKKKTGLIVGISAAAAVLVAAVVLVILLWPKSNKDTTTPQEDSNSSGTVTTVDPNGSGNSTYDNDPTEPDDTASLQRVVLASLNDHTVGLNADGSVVATGYNTYNQCSVSGWRNIVAVSAGYYHTVGLKSDGTVVAAGKNSDHQCDVSNWRDIIAVSAGGSFTVGLKKDGTVVAVGDNDCGQCNVSAWTDIVAIAAGRDHTVGLRSDGTVVAVGYNDFGQCDVMGFTNVAQINAGPLDTFVIFQDGKVSAASTDTYGMYQTGTWRNIKALALGLVHSVALKSDGTVIAAGNNEYGQCNVSGWKNIVAIAAGCYYTVGLKADGTVVATGSNEDGQCSVSSWNLN